MDKLYFHARLEHDISAKVMLNTKLLTKTRFLHTILRCLQLCANLYSRKPAIMWTTQELSLLRLFDGRQSDFQHQFD